MSIFNPSFHPYSSTRRSVYAQNGMVATSQPLASQAGLDILKKGGNAVDAAIATAACLTVVEPTKNGIGGDAFAIVWIKDKIYGLNASGPAPQGISIDKLRNAGYESIPKYGLIPVTVPGAPSAWASLSERFGQLPFDSVMAPAIKYARDGFPVSPIISKYWKKAYHLFKEKLKDPIFASWFETFAPDNHPPEVGEIWASADHAKSLQSIADTKAESFYRGQLADKIDRFSKSNGGYLTIDDLANYQSEWVDPVKVNYRGYDVWELPPNGQGLITLQALNLLKGFEFEGRDNVNTYHKQIESMKLAFSDGNKYITDPKNMSVEIDALLSDRYSDERRRLIGSEAIKPEAGRPHQGGTIYLATADQDGNMVSFIQSNYMGFGSGLVVPGTGIALQNRGHNFSFNESHDNVLMPGKRSYNTIIPGFLSKNNEAIGPFGVMGGFMQPQGHVQMVMNTIDFHLSPQASLDAPRWQWIRDKNVYIEHTFSHEIAEALIEKGHNINIEFEPNVFGRGQIIWMDKKKGTFVGGTESRTDGSIAAW